MKKWVLGFLALFFILAGSLYFYVSCVFIPVQLKQIIVEQARSRFGRNLQFADIHFSFPAGVIIRQVTLYQKGSSTQPFLSIEEARFAIIPDLFAPKQIFIPSLTISKPFVHIIRSPDRSWNFQDLLAKKTTPGKKSPLSFFLGGIVLERGKIQITDESVQPVWQEIVTPLSLNVSLSASKGIKFETTVPFTQHPGSLKLHGTYRLTRQELQCQATAENIDLARLLSLENLPLPLNMPEGFIEKATLTFAKTKDEMSLQGAGAAQVDLSVPERFALKGRFRSNHFRWQKTPDGFSFSTKATRANDGRFILPDRVTVTGDLVLTNADFRLAQTQLAAKGEMQLQKGSLLLPHDRSFTGTIALSLAEWHRSEGQSSGKATLSSPDAVITDGERQFRGAIAIPAAAWQQKNDLWDCSGTLDLKKADWRGAGQQHFSGDLKTQRLAILRQDHTWQVKTAATLSNANLVFKPEQQFTGDLAIKEADITLEPQQLAVTTTAVGKDVHMSLPKGLAITGSPQLSLDLKYPFPTDEEQPPLPLHYAGTLILNGDTLTGVPKVETISDLKGTVAFSDNQASTDKLSFVTSKTPLTVSGSIVDFKNPVLDIQAAGQDVVFTQVAPLFPELLQKYQVAPSGEADFQINFQGQPQEWTKAKIAGQLILNDAALAGGKISPPVTQINGQISYQDNTITWKNLSGTWQDRHFTIDGNYQIQPARLIETTVSAEGVALTTLLQPGPEGFDILKLTGHFQDTTFSGKGHFAPGKTGPYLELETKLSVELKDLPQMHPLIAEKIKDLHLLGQVGIQATFQGRINQWPTSALTLTAKSKEVTIASYKFNNLILNIKHGGTDISQINLKALLDDGDLVIDLLADPRKEDMPGTFSLDLAGTDLAKMGRDAQWPAKDISGKLKAQLKLDGPLLKTAALTGYGNFAITDGKIWKLTILKGLWQLLLIPELNNAVFTEASATFTVQKNKLITQDLLLKSQPLDLAGQGWLDINKNIDLLITPRFHQLEILKSSAILQKIPTGLLTQTQGYFNIRLTDTLTKPKYKIETDPGRVLQGTTGNLLEGVQGILEGILQ